MLHVWSVCPDLSWEGCFCERYDAEQIEKSNKAFLNSDAVLEVIRFRGTIRRFKQEQIPEDNQADSGDGQADARGKKQAGCILCCA